MNDWLCSTIEYKLYPIGATHLTIVPFSGFQLFHGAHSLSEKLSTAASRHYNYRLLTLPGQRCNITGLAVRQSAQPRTITT